MDLLVLDATNGTSIRTAGVVHVRGTKAEVEVIRAVAERSGRPIVTAVTTIVGTTIAATAITGSREKHLSSFARIW